MPSFHYRFISAFLASCILCCLSCNKDDDGHLYTAGHVPIPQNMRDYFAFDYGSFIVYKDSATGTVDSTYVTDIYAFTTVCQDAYCTSYDYLGVTWQSNAFGDYAIYCNSETGVNDGPNMMRSNATRKTIHVANNMQIDLEYVCEYNSIWDAVTLTEIIPTYNTGTIQFTDVMRIEHTYDPIIEYACVFYVARYVGIIRIEIPDLGRVWEVENYNIVPL